MDRRMQTVALDHPDISLSNEYSPQSTEPPGWHAPSLLLWINPLFPILISLGRRQLSGSLQLGMSPIEGYI